MTILGMECQDPEHRQSDELPVSRTCIQEREIRTEFTAASVTLSEKALNSLLSN
jgi:hypothetical protein